MALEITDSNFASIVNQNEKPVMIDFWAEWCGPCKAIAPAVDQLAAEFEGRAIIGKLNVDENSQIPVQFGIRGIPTLLFFKNGQVADKQVGLVSKDVLKAKLEALLK
ncbi:MAG: thioredoxin [Flavobacteriales bacterium]|nr:thioredoxin [Flavobacteriales bacterium]MCX7649877.1 thioredoxin [Flavobacteriales bacterium]MDW8431107.1 thioredoxin [Flavobacteriales bacterium]